MVEHAISEQLSLKGKNVLVYIAGYINREVRNKVCSSSEKLLYTSVETGDTDNLTFIKTKKYDGAKNGLIFPSK